MGVIVLHPGTKGGEVLHSGSLNKNFGAFSSWGLATKILIPALRVSTAMEEAVARDLTKDLCRETDQGGQNFL